jgi:hypothetical protein
MLSDSLVYKALSPGPPGIWNGARGVSTGVAGVDLARSNGASTASTAASVFEKTGGQ